MANFPRYAIYYSPEPGSVLDRFGAELLGYDAHLGVELSFPSSMNLPTDWRELTQDPRKYGFHGTLKAPMALAPEKSEEELIAACAAFAETPRPIPNIEPIVGTIEGFIAIVPAFPPRQLEALAADCVREFDGFRSPLDEHDRARRNPSGLTSRQRDYLDRWGYPYVFEEFRFHMTLTGRLESGPAQEILTLLREVFSKLPVQSLAIDRIALFRQDDAQGRFRILDQWKLNPNL